MKCRGISAYCLSNIYIYIYIYIYMSIYIYIYICLYISASTPLQSLIFHLWQNVHCITHLILEEPTECTIFH